MPARCAPRAGAPSIVRGRTAGCRAWCRLRRGCASRTAWRRRCASRLSTSATGSGFRVSRSSRRCIFAMSSVRKQRLANPSPCAARTLRMRSALAPVAGRRHQFQRHVVEREQHAVGAVAAVLPGRRPRKQRLVRRLARRDIAGENDDMIETGNHGNSPRVSWRSSLPPVRSHRPEPRTAAGR